MADQPRDKCWLHSPQASAILPCTCASYNANALAQPGYHPHSLQLKCRNCYSVHKGWQVRAIFCWKLPVHLKGASSASPDWNCVSFASGLVCKESLQEIPKNVINSAWQTIRGSITSVGSHGNAWYKRQQIYLYQFFGQPNCTEQMAA